MMTDTLQTHTPTVRLRGHALSVRSIFQVYGALLALTLLTIAATLLDLGQLNVWVALLIAAAKGALVVLFFMQLKYENRFFGITLIAALLFVSIFIGVATLDGKETQAEFDAPPGIGVAP